MKVSWSRYTQSRGQKNCAWRAFEPRHSTYYAFRPALNATILQYQHRASAYGREHPVDTLIFTCCVEVIQQQWLSYHITCYVYDIRLPSCMHYFVSRLRLLRSSGCPSMHACLPSSGVSKLGRAGSKHTVIERWAHTIIYLHKLVLCSLYPDYLQLPACLSHHLAARLQWSTTLSANKQASLGPGRFSGRPTQFTRQYTLTASSTPVC